MGILLVPSQFASIAEALQAANADDVIRLESGYKDETATVTLNVTVEGTASSTGIRLLLGTGTFVKLGGSAPIDVEAVDGSIAVFGNAGANVISSGTGLINVITGGAGDDTLTLYGRGDAEGGNGNDLIVADYGAPNGFGGVDLKGDAGDDTITGGQDADFLNGGYGDDILNGGGRGDLITDISGLDVANSGNDVMSGGDGDDKIHSWSGQDTIDGGAGDDHVSLERPHATADLTFNMTNRAAITTLEGDGANVINAEALWLSGGGGNDHFATLSGDDNLIGGDGNDTLAGRGGDDHLSGDNQRDRLFGGAGDDYLDGGRGKDVLKGGGGNDHLEGDPGLGSPPHIDRLVGGLGNDTLSSYGGADLLVGGAGIDTAYLNRFKGTTDLSLEMKVGGATTTLVGDGAVIKGVEVINLVGGAGNDRILSADGDDTLAGSGGSDTLSGGGGNDFLSGGFSTDDDKLFGGTGDDLLSAGGGNDHLTGGHGSDTLFGDVGDDVFIYNAANEAGLSDATRDVIENFERGSDRIDLSAIDAIPGGGDDAFSFIGGQDFTAAGQVRVVQTVWGAVVEVNASGASGADMSILMQYIDAADVAASDFFL